MMGRASHNLLAGSQESMQNFDAICLFKVHLGFLCVVRSLSNGRCCSQPELYHSQATRSSDADVVSFLSSHRYAHENAAVGSAPAIVCPSSRKGPPAEIAASLVAAVALGSSLPVEDALHNHNR